MNICRLQNDISTPPFFSYMPGCQIEECIIASGRTEQSTPGGCPCDSCGRNNTSHLCIATHALCLYRRLERGLPRCRNRSLCASLPKCKQPRAYKLECDTGIEMSTSRASRYTAPAHQQGNLDITSRIIVHIVHPLRNVGQDRLRNAAQSCTWTGSEQGREAAIDREPGTRR